MVYGFPLPTREADRPIATGLFSAIKLVELTRNRYIVALEVGEGALRAPEARAALEDGVYDDGEPGSCKRRCRSERALRTAAYRAQLSGCSGCAIEARRSVGTATACVPTNPRTTLARVLLPALEGAIEDDDRSSHVTSRSRDYA